MEASDLRHPTFRVLTFRDGRQVIAEDVETEIAARTASLRPLTSARPGTMPTATMSSCAPGRACWTGGPAPAPDGAVIVPAGVARAAL